jgi:hypothetical protein
MPKERSFFSARTAGDVTVPLFGGPDFWFVQDNAPALTPDNVATAFQAGDMYFNIHNDVYTGGAIRLFSVLRQPARQARIKCDMADEEESAK